MADVHILRGEQALQESEASAAFQLEKATLVRALEAFFVAPEAGRANGALSLRHKPRCSAVGASFTR